MASRKKLKKAITNICGNLFLESVLIARNSNVDFQKKDDVMVQILSLLNEMITRINHTEKGSTKLFYKNLKELFNKQVQEIENNLLEL